MKACFTLAILLAPIVAPSLHAQAGINPGALGARDPGRILERMERRAATQDRLGRRAAQAAVSPDSVPPKYVVSLTPSYVTSDALKVYSVSAAVTNTQQTDPKVPFKAGLSGKLLDASGDHHNRFQADLELDSPSDFLHLDKNTSALVTGEYQRTATLSNAQEATVEVDHVFSFDKTGIALSGIEYYDRSTPIGGQSADGFTTGVAAGLSYQIAKQYKVGAGGEYDINSPYNGEASYNGQLSISSSAISIKPKLFVGWARHGVVVIGATVSWP
jgi:hypothetical protein